MRLLCLAIIFLISVEAFPYSINPPFYLGTYHNGPNSIIKFFKDSNCTITAWGCFGIYLKDTLKWSQQKDTLKILNKNGKIFKLYLIDNQGYIHSTYTAGNFKISKKDPYRINDTMGFNLNSNRFDSMFYNNGRIKGTSKIVNSEIIEHMYYQSGKLESIKRYIVSTNNPVGEWIYYNENGEEIFREFQEVEPIDFKFKLNDIEH